MDYQIIPVGEFWQQGMVAFPKKIATEYLRLSSEYQLKALLLLLANDGICDSKTIAKLLGCTEDDATDFLEFWVEEGILSCNGEVVEKKENVSPNPKPKSETLSSSKKESTPVPVLAQKDIIEMCKNNSELTMALRSAQEVLGTNLNHVEKELIINMITYYGLPTDVVLVILQYYKSEKQKGKAIGTAYIAAMAKNWSEEGIVNLELADEKLLQLETSDKRWNEIIAISGLRHRNPTIKQREMIARWFDDFDIQMITVACDIMKENTDKPTLKYVDGVLKNWKKKGIFTPQDVANEQQNYQKSKQSKSKGDIDETYDINEINRRAMMNDDYDI